MDVDEALSCEMLSHQLSWANRSSVKRWKECSVLKSKLSARGLIAINCAKIRAAAQAWVEGHHGK